MNGALTEDIGVLSRGLDELLPVVREPLGGEELIAAQRELQVLSRKVLAAQLELDAAVEDVGLAQHHGYPSVRALLADMHRLTPREATRQEQRTQLAARRSLTGEVLPPRLPETARALAEGAIGPSHVEIVDKFITALPDSFDPQLRATVEEQVAGFARDYTPRETGLLAAQLLARLDPDGPAPEDRGTAPDPNNTLHLGRSRRGRLRLSGSSTPTVKP